jgi:hypothetical protein
MKRSTPSENLPMISLRLKLPTTNFECPLNSHTWKANTISIATARTPSTPVSFGAPEVVVVAVDIDKMVPKMMDAKRHHTLNENSTEIN